ncbi:unnamed protein product, partial [Ceratitis capitata]
CPNDLPSALALAQEVESNHERYLFASNFAWTLEDKAQKIETNKQFKDKSAGGRGKGKTPISVEHGLNL